MILKILLDVLDWTGKCAAVCRSATGLMSFGGVHAALLGESCAEICNACVEECENFPDLEHCERRAEETPKMAAQHA